MNFIFMIILILLILILFNIYIKNINTYFYTFILVSLLLINELYFYKIENFTYNDKFKNNFSKQLCKYMHQQQIIESPMKYKPNNCYKINNISDCVNNTNCIYNFEVNKCMLDDKCHKLNDSSLECYYMNTKNECEQLSKNMKYCPKLSEKECRNDNNCKWNNNDCKFAKESCISNNRTKCLASDNCNWNEYADIYNIENNSNIVNCYDFNSISNIIKYNNLIHPNKISDINSIDDVYAILNDKKNDNIKFYGIMKKNNKLELYLFNDGNIDYLNSANSLMYKCLDKNKYLGSDTEIIIYKRNGVCNTKTKCNWKKIKNNICNLTNNKDICIENGCDYNKYTNTCSEKGTCYKKCETIDSGQCEKEVDMDGNQLCKLDADTQKCITK